MHFKKRNFIQRPDYSTAATASNLVILLILNDGFTGFWDPYLHLKFRRGSRKLFLSYSLPNSKSCHPRWSSSAKSIEPSGRERKQSPELSAINKARCGRCGRCRSFLVSHWIISIGQPIGGHITLSKYTYHNSPLFETLSIAKVL